MAVANWLFDCLEAEIADQTEVASTDCSIRLAVSLN